VGTLFYGADRLPVQFDDRTLAHLQLVMTAKLRRSEGFLLSWTAARPDDGARSTVWIHPATDLHFAFADGRAPAINREWIGRLVLLANTPAGLRVTEEGDVRSLDPAP
jgi:hypothetical protein